MSSVLHKDFDDTFQLPLDKASVCLFTACIPQTPLQYTPRFSLVVVNANGRAWLLRGEGC